MSEHVTSGFVPSYGIYQKKYCPLLNVSNVNNKTGEVCKNVKWCSDSDLLIQLDCLFLRML